jgi:hypothetical protein
MPNINKPRSVFTEMIKRESRSGEYPADKAKVSQKWLLKKARSARYRRVGTSKLRRSDGKLIHRKLAREDPDSLKTRIMIGHMYLFTYNPKAKKTLEYYDTFPLVFPIERYPDGFLGVNLHYLDPLDRAILMDALYESVSDENYDENTKLRLTYNIMSGISKYRHFRPCIKRYLTSQVTSKFQKINSEDWDNIIFLPLERFEKANRRKVWNASKKEVIEKNAV